MEFLGVERAGTGPWDFGRCEVKAGSQGMNVLLCSLAVALKPYRSSDSFDSLMDVWNHSWKHQIHSLSPLFKALLKISMQPWRLVRPKTCAKSLLKLFVVVPTMRELGVVESMCV